MPEGITVYLIEADLLHIASGNLHRFFFATAPGYVSQPTDDMPLVVYPPLIEQAADVELVILTFGEVDDATQVRIGESILANYADWQRQTPIRAYDLTDEVWVTLPFAARPLNRLFTDYVLGGQAIKILAGPQHGSRDTEFEALLTTKTEMPELARAQIALTPRDKALDFDTPVLVEQYTGAGGLNGTADMEGRTKERTFGHVLSLEPTYLGNVQDAKPTFSVNGGHAIEDIVAVYDDYVQLDEVTVGIPALGEWRQDASNATFWLGGTNFGRVTCEVKGDKTGGIWRVTGADLIEFWATTHSGILDLTEVDQYAIDSLATAAPYTLSFWFPSGDQRTHRQVYDEASRSYRGHWLLDENGILSVGQVLPPVGPPVREFRRDIDHRGLVPRPAGGRRMPARAALIRFGQNFAVADPGVLDTDAVNGDARNIATTQWREAQSPDDAGVVAAYGLNNARLIIRETPILSRANAETEADALRDDAKVPRALYDMVCTTLFADVRRLDTIRVYDDLPGFEDGKLVRVIGKNINQRASISSFVVRE